jgi:hypothetical protein
MSTVWASSARWCSQREPNFQSDTLMWATPPFGSTQYSRIRSVSVNKACHTFSGVVAI